MAEQYVLFVDNIKGLDLDGLSPASIDTALYRAVNKAADEGRKRAADRMLDQVNFPSSYLKGKNSRLYQSSYATRGKAEAVISGRFRPTSLARFASPGKLRNGVAVTVKPGRQRIIKNAFLMKLKSGGDSLGNLGLAVRTKRGEKPRGAFRPVKINDRLWLLYGPSVSQVFKTVRVDVSPATAMVMEQEFSRLIDLEMKKK